MSVAKETAVTAAPEREDLFVLSTGHHFPCACCSHLEDHESVACVNCRYFFNEAARRGNV